MQPTRATSSPSTSSTSAVSRPRCSATRRRHSARSGTWSAGFAGNDYIVYGDERITYANAHRDVRAVAQWLREQAVEQGDRRDRDAQPARVGHRLLGGAGDRRGRRTAQRGGPDPSSRMDSPIQASVVLVADDERAERCRTSAKRACGRRCSCVPRVSPRQVPWSAAVRSNDTPLPARGRSRCRRRDHVHVRHDRQAEGRCPDAAELHELPHAGCVRHDADGRAGGHLTAAAAITAAGHAAHVPPVPRGRAALVPASTRRPAGRSC